MILETEGVSTGPDREKHWDELLIDEKLERTRGRVKSLDRALGYMRDEMRRLESKIRRLENHTHVNNEVMVPVRESEGHGGLAEEGSVGWPDADLYF